MVAAPATRIGRREESANAMGRRGVQKRCSCGRREASIDGTVPAMLCISTCVHTCCKLADAQYCSSGSTCKLCSARPLHVYVHDRSGANESKE